MIVPLTKLDRQLEYVPKTVIWCKKCVLSSQRPRLGFRADGVCTACEYSEYLRTQVDWKKRDEEFRDFLTQYRSKTGAYDCLVPSSGGKDSGFVASLLKEEYQMHPLAVTATPFQRTEIGATNFRNFIYSGYPTIEVHFNGKLHRKLARLCMETLGDPWQPFGYAQMAVPHQLAVRLGIPLIAYGESGEAIYSGAIKIREMLGMATNLWAEQYHKGVTAEELIKWGVANTDYLTDADFCDDDLDWYRPPPQQVLEKAGVLMMWTSNWVLWTPQESMYRAVKYTGFQMNGQRSVSTHTRYASLDDILDPWHYTFGFAKWGLSRSHYDCSHEIRDGHITREEAIALVKRFGDELPPQQYVDFACDYMQISEDYLWGVLDAWRSPHLWTEGTNGWELKHQVS